MLQLLLFFSVFVCLSLSPAVSASLFFSYFSLSLSTSLSPSLAFSLFISFISLFLALSHSLSLCVFISFALSLFLQRTFFSRSRHGRRLLDGCTCLAPRRGLVLSSPGHRHHRLRLRQEE